MEIKQICKDWYWNENVAKRDFIMWEILKDIRRHSTDFIGQEFANTRFYRIGKFGFLIGQIKARFIDTENPYWHFFKSIALIRFLNGKGEVADVNKEFDSLIYGWDLIFDFDSKAEDINDRMKESYKEAKKVKDYFDKLKVPYLINFSGNAGFHIRIYWDDLQKYFKYTDYGTSNKELGAFVIKQCKAKVDTCTMGGGRNLIRVLYSINPKSGLVCYPLTNEEFEKFNLQMADPYYILEHINPLDRKPKKREGDLGELWKQWQGKVHTN